MIFPPQFTSDPSINKVSFKWVKLYILKYVFKFSHEKLLIINENKAIKYIILNFIVLVTWLF